jgi:hypothetical protein
MSKHEGYKRGIRKTIDLKNYSSYYKINNGSVAFVAERRKESIVVDKKDIRGCSFAEIRDVNINGDAEKNGIVKIRLWDISNPLIDVYGHRGQMELLYERISIIMK